MNRILIGMLIGALAATLSLDAEAQRRLGGGRNVGQQSPQVQQRQATPPAATPAQTPQGAAAAAPAAAAGAATAAARSPMRNLLIGAAAGLGLMALASYLGFGETMATIMLFALIGVVILMVIGYFMRRRMGAQPAYQGADGTPPAEQRLEPQPMQRSALDSSAARPGSAMDHFMRGGAVNPATPWGIPEGFDVEGFVANARTYFGKLQASWVTGNLEELSDFTTNDMFIALTHELRARGDAPKSIEVQTLETRLLGIESTATQHLASVRFTGAVRVDGEEEKVDEVWNLAKSADGKTGWLLAGIQQIA